MLSLIFNFLPDFIHHHPTIMYSISLLSVYYHNVDALSRDSYYSGTITIATLARVTITDVYTGLNTSRYQWTYTVPRTSVT